MKKEHGTVALQSEQQGLSVSQRLDERAALAIVGGAVAAVPAFLLTEMVGVGLVFGAAGAALGAVFYPIVKSILNSKAWVLNDPSVPEPPAGDALDRFGHRFLDYFDYRQTILLVAAVVVVLVLVSRKRNGKWPDGVSIGRACIGAVSIAMSLVVLCVFGLTKPPYIKALSHEALAIIGLVTFFICFILGIREVVSLVEKAELKKN
jgi:hypothetical protein